MAVLPTQKYKNIQREVSGTVNVDPTDSVLNCDTSTGAVVINLCEIPADFWSTQYKLYVIDNANNANTNNITINAPSGFFINGLTTLIINQNGAGAVIRIGNNTNYIVNLTYGVAPITDTGWLDLNGFSWIQSPLVRPQYRVIGKEIFFRNNLFVPLDKGGSLLPMTQVSGWQGTNYVSETSVLPSSASGGGVVLNVNGSMTFNNGLPVLQDPSHYPDQNYNAGFVVGSRRMVSDLQTFSNLYFGVFGLTITSSGTLVLGVLKDSEQGAPGQPIGQSSLRYINTKVLANDYALDFRSISDGANPATLDGAQVNPFTPEISRNSSGAKHTVSLDAAEENQIGGFGVNIATLKAYRN